MSRLVHHGKANGPDTGRMTAGLRRDPILEPVFRSVGSPAVVEAAIPISYFEDSLGYEMEIAKRFYSWRAKHPYEGVPHDRARASIPAEYVRRIVMFEAREFADLTGCDGHFEPLMPHEHRKLCVREARYKI